MKAWVIAPQELNLEHQKRWADIRNENQALASPFFAPEFTSAIGDLRRDARVGIIEDGREIVGYFPFQRRPFGFGRAIGLGMNDFHGLVCRSDAGIDQAWLLRSCALRQWTTDHLITPQSTLLDLPNSTHDSPYIRFSEGFQAYVDQMKSERRPGVGRALRKRKRLQDAFGNELSFVWHSGSTVTLDRLLALKSAQCQAAGTYDYTRHRWIRQLLLHLLQVQTAEFGGVLAELRIGDRTVAMHFGLRSGKRLHWWLPAYEPEWRSWSPGLVLLLGVIEQANRFGIDQIDLGRDLSRYKQEFMNGMETVHAGMICLDPRTALLSKIAKRVAAMDQGPDSIRRWLLRPAAGATRLAMRMMRFQ